MEGPVLRRQQTSTQEIRGEPQSPRWDGRREALDGQGLLLPPGQGRGGPDSRTAFRGRPAGPQLHRGAWDQIISRASSLKTKQTQTKNKTPRTPKLLSRGKETSVRKV